MPLQHCINHSSPTLPISEKVLLSEFPTYSCTTTTTTEEYERKDATELWNQRVITDKEVTANRPDIEIKNQKEETSILKDVVIPEGRNVTQKGSRNDKKYKRL